MGWGATSWPPFFTTNMESVKAQNYEKKLIVQSNQMAVIISNKLSQVEVTFKQQPTV